MPRPALRAVPIIIAALLAGCTGAARPPEAYGTLVALRHADRTFAPLNAAGVARAKALPAALSDLEIDAIYATPRGRNVATAEPLARALGLPIETMPATAAAANLFAEYPGGTVVWVGNQENLGLLFAQLGIAAKPPVQFGDLWVIDLPEAGGPARVERRHYGI